MAYLGHKLPDGLEPGLDETVFYDPKGMGSPSGIHISYVEVDPETGIVDILDYVAVDDAGTIINPLLASGQIHGGVVQGIAQALYEEVSYDLDTGQLMTGSLLDYAVPRAEHVPSIRSVFQETPSPTNPIGVKGIGENGSIAAPPCMVHAVLDALSPFRDQASRHADDTTAGLVGDPDRARRSKPMIPASFDYVRATSLTQAIGLLQKDPDGTKLVAGGHTLIPTLKLRLASPALLVDICGIDDLKGIEVGDRIRIGALTTPRRAACVRTSAQGAADLPSDCRSDC